VHVKIAITDVFPAHWHPLVEAAAPAEWHYELAVDGDLDKRMEMVRDADAVLCGSAPPTSEMFAAAKQLRFVQKLGAGFDNIDVELLKSRDIGVARLAGNNAVAVAEHTVLLMLATLRRLPYIDSRLRAGDWGKQLARAGNRELRGKVVGLVGLGQIGRQVVRRLAGFEVNTIYYDVNRASPADEAELGVEYVSLDDLVRMSDIVSLHLPLFPETRELINADLLSRFKPGAVLVNCARGELVDEAALVAALRSGQLSGAGLDCFADESAGGSQAFWELTNTVLTGHHAGVSEENFATMMERAFSNTQSYLAGEPLPAADVIWVPDHP
jgi:phosphoglycerate dehydrogenase-like enzyme